MRKGLSIAIAVEAIVLFVSVALFVACMVFEVGQRHIVMNLVAIMALVVVSSAMLLVLWWRSLRRDELIRCFFISNDWVYNHEIGYAPLRKVVPDGDVYGFVTFAADALAKMSYGFEVADAPANFQPTLIISSGVFNFHFAEGDEEGDPCDMVVVDRWRGMLQRIERDEVGKRSYVEAGQFSNARELAQLLDENSAFDKSGQQMREAR